MIQISQDFKDFITRNYDHIIESKDHKNLYNLISREFSQIYSNYEIISTFIMLFHISEHRVIKMNSVIRLDRNKDELLQALTNAINKHPSNLIRSKIVDKHYNFEDNIYEYELENGDFIPCLNPKKQMLKIPYDIFPLEFLQKYDLVYYRMSVIKEIIK